MTIIKCYLIDISLWEIKRADVVVIIIFFFNKSWETTYKNNHGENGA